MNLARLDAARATSPVPASRHGGRPGRCFAERRAFAAGRSRRQAGRVTHSAAVGAQVRPVRNGRGCRGCEPAEELSARPALGPRSWPCPAGGVPAWANPVLGPARLVTSAAIVVFVQATLAPGADRQAAGRWHVRLVDPSRPSQWRVLAKAEFKVAGSRLLAELLHPAVPRRHGSRSSTTPGDRFAAPRRTESSGRCGGRMPRCVRSVRPKGSHHGRPQQTGRRSAGSPGSGVVSTGRQSATTGGPRPCWSPGCQCLGRCTSPRSWASDIRTAARRRRSPGGSRPNCPRR